MSVKKKKRDKAAKVTSQFTGFVLLSATLVRRVRTYHHELWLLLLAEAAMVVALVLSLPTIGALGTANAPNVGTGAIVASSLDITYSQVKSQISTLLNDEAENDVNVVSAPTAQGQLAAADMAIDRRDYVQGHKDLVTLAKRVKLWNGQILAAISAKPAVPVTPIVSSNALFVPILLYHKPPADFATQMQVLVSKGYTTIDMSQLYAALAGGDGLPAKPVVISFDDGFAAQMDAIPILEQYHLKATFFIIDGGQISNWCIGAGRQYNLPSQPPGGCGDQYMTWDQIRSLDHNSLFTIGSHTIDHLALGTVSPATQWYEIETGKTELEQEIGHTVYDFAYPYGSYTSTTIALLKQAGFRTAVTTNAGYEQTMGDFYTLNRVRDTYSLP